PAGDPPADDELHPHRHRACPHAPGARPAVHAPQPGHRRDGAVPHAVRDGTHARTDPRRGLQAVHRAEDRIRGSRVDRQRAAARLHAAPDARVRPRDVRGDGRRRHGRGSRAGRRRPRRRGCPATRGRGSPDAHPHSRFRGERAEDRVPDRIPRLHSLPDDRPDRVERADVDGDDDALARAGIAALQADALRSGRWLEPSRRLDGHELLRTKHDAGVRGPGGPPGPRGAAGRGGAPAGCRAGRRPRGQRAPGDHPDQREHAVVPAQAAGARGDARHRRSVAAVDADRLHPRRLPVDPRGDRLMLSITDAQLFGWLSSFLLPFFRILGLFTTAPILSQRSVPLRVQIGLSALAAAIVAPSIEVGAGGFGGPNLVTLVAHEVLVGLTLGFVARVVFSAFELAGEAIGLQMGLSFAGFYDPQSGSGNPVSRFLNTTALTAFVVMNGPGMLLMAVAESFRVIPVDIAFGWLAGRSPLPLATQMFAL